MLYDHSERTSALRGEVVGPKVDLVLGPKLFFVTGLVKFATAVARLVCPDLLG